MTPTGPKHWPRDLRIPGRPRRLFFGLARVVRATRAGEAVGTRSKSHPRLARGIKRA